MKTIFITGGSRGIGREVARLAICEYNVCFTYFNSENKAKELVQELSKKGMVFAIKCDVKNSKDVNIAIDSAISRFGSIDVLVNNAGIAQQKMVQDITDEDWKTMINTNLSGVFFACRKVIDSMVSRKTGAIINVASMWGEVGSSMESHYSASKAGLIGLTKALAKELAPSNITVNAVSPGVVDTDMMADFSSEDLDLIIQDIPLGRICSPHEIARAILFVASCENMTGQVLSINGGVVI